MRLRVTVFTFLMAGAASEAARAQCAPAACLIFFSRKSWHSSYSSTPLPLKTRVFFLAFQIHQSIRGAAPSLESWPGARRNTRGSACQIHTHTKFHQPSCLKSSLACCSLRRLSAVPSVGTGRPLAVSIHSASNQSLVGQGESLHPEKSILYVLGVFPWIIKVSTRLEK